MTNDPQHPGPSDPTPGPTEQVPAPTEQFTGADPSAQNLGYAQYEGSPSLYDQSPYDQQPPYGAPGEQYGYIGAQPYTAQPYAAPPHAGQPYTSQPYGQAYPAPAYPAAPGKSGRSPVVMILAVVIALLVIGSLGALGYHFWQKNDADTAAAVDGSSAGEPAGPARYTGPAPSGLPSNLSSLLPAAIGPTISSCVQDSTLWYENNGPVASGYDCDMSVDGNLGALTIVQNPSWVADAAATRLQRPGYQELQVPGYTAYQFTWNTGRTTLTGTSLIDESQSLYMDFLPRSATQGGVPSDAEGTAFRRSLHDVLGAQ